MIVKNILYNYAFFCGLNFFLSVIIAPVAYSGHDVKRQDTAIISEYIRQSKEFSDTNVRKGYDSAIYYLNNALSLSEKAGHEGYLYQVYDTFAEVLIKTGNFSIALDYYFKMLKILDEEARKGKDVIATKKQYETLFKQIGRCFCIQVKDTETAISYFRKSLNMAEDIYLLDSSYNIRDSRIRIFNNIGSSYMDAHNPDSANFYLKKALQLSEEEEANPGYQAPLYNNLGIINCELGNYEESAQYFENALHIHIESNNSLAMARVHLNIGLCHYTQKDYSSAVDEFERSLEYCKQESDQTTKLLIVNALSEGYEKLGKYQNAIEMFRLGQTLQDSVSSVEKVRNSVQVELQYQFAKQEKEKELQQQIILAKKERAILIYILIAILLLMALLLLMLLYRNQRVKGKQIRLEQESLALQNENLELKNQQLEQSLEYKKKELDMQLMYLLKKKEYVSSIIDQMLEVKETEPSQVKSLMKNIKTNLEDSVSNEFKILFQELHQDFYTNLYNKHPDLTPNEKKLCAFIRLNMSSKDISSITFQSVKSIEIARSRLRARMNLDRKDNLTLYLQQF